MGDRESALGFLHEIMRMKYESAMIYEEKGYCWRGTGIGTEYHGDQYRDVWNGDGVKTGVGVVRRARGNDPMPGT